MIQNENVIIMQELLKLQKQIKISIMISFFAMGAVAGLIMTEIFF